jgi:hypothetical protein
MGRHLFYGFVLLACGLTMADDIQSRQKSVYDLTLKELLEVTVITAASGYEQNVSRVSAN